MWTRKLKFRESFKLAGIRITVVKCNRSGVTLGFELPADKRRRTYEIVREIMSSQKFAGEDGT